ncbi:sigma-70 family RNA polymerase sigma factor [Actinosynnema sp. NPDC023794]
MPDNAQFADDTERYRGELLAHCYRMLGSVDDAEDVVQETYLRAWRSYGGFEGRSSVRAWLYRIATNASLTALRRRSRRVLPSGLGGPAGDPDAPQVPAGPGVLWLQPFPTSAARGHDGARESGDPAVIVGERESLRLALVASLQYLAGRQRAVLLLRDVLAFPAGEVAEMLDTTTAAVKSTLQRARARLAEVSADVDQVTEPDEPEIRALVDRYAKAFEDSDAAALERLLRADARLETVPSATWFAGKRTCAPFIARHAIGTPGEWRLVPVEANGQPGTAVYRRGEDGVRRAFGITVLTLAADGIARIVLFTDPDLVEKFGLPATAPA